MQTNNLRNQLNTAAVLAGQIPVVNDRHATWLVKLYVDEPYDPGKYTRPNRRDYYKIILVTQGSAVLMAGPEQYNITAPAIVCLHPRDIISWKLHNEEPVAAKAIYIRQEALRNSSVRSVMKQCRLFDPAANRVAVVSLSNDLTVLMQYFVQMQETANKKEYPVEFLVGYLQLLFVEIRQRCLTAPAKSAANLPAQVKQFFELLENETARLSAANPLQLKTAKEYAMQLAVHPNYLNAIIKKHTGQNVSTHIKTRLVEEAKSLLLQTDWTIKEISYMIGFSDPPNFSMFFKSNTGQTPADFRNRSISI
ncbi:MAG: AraC family transcriptional regulator [Niastella sp.]|nr:AraC family transcriptional regulator [Niastella sp.]